MTVLPFASDTEIAAAIPAVVSHVRRGGVIAYPTETVYGFGGAATPAMTEAVARLKGRPPEKQLLVLIDGLAMLGAVDARLNTVAETLIAHFWPGPLTLILPPHGVAVRWTSHAGVARLLEAYGAPLTSTSANRAGLAPARSGGEIAQQWNADVTQGVLLVLDGGLLPERPPSTLVDCTTPTPRVLREAAITVDQLRMIVPEVTRVG